MNLEVHLECSQVLGLLSFRIVDVVIFSYLLLMQKWEDLVLPEPGGDESSAWRLDCKEP